MYWPIVEIRRYYILSPTNIIGASTIDNVIGSGAQCLFGQMCCPLNSLVPHKAFSILTTKEALKQAGWTALTPFP